MNTFEVQVNVVNFESLAGKCIRLHCHEYLMLLWVDDCCSKVY